MDFIFAFSVVGQIKLNIFQFKMFKIESCVCCFHVYYVRWTPCEEEVLRLAKL